MSNTICILDELMAALAAAPSHVDHLLHLGVPPAAVDMCGTAKIRPDGDLYQPDDDGLEAVVVPVFDGGEIADLLAFTLADPARWWTRLGAHWALGADALDCLWLCDQLRVYRTPLRWLRAGAPYNGLAILDCDAAKLHIPRVEIVTEDLAHGLELDRLLTIPAQRPQVRVPRKVAA